ncbi:MAG TPA: hypothetical protein VF060_22795 [Trebonia sp.]
MKPLVIMALPAAVAVWSGWVQLGMMCGFGVAQPLPGIVPWHINTAVTLPVGTEAYAAFALGAWLHSSTPELAKKPVTVPSEVSLNPLVGPCCRRCINSSRLSLERPPLRLDHEQSGVRQFAKHLRHGGLARVCLRHEPNGTFTRDRDGQPADLLNIRDYPVRSTCCLCGVEVITCGIIGRAAEWYDAEQGQGDRTGPTVFPRDGWSISG